ncbi:hypothetical protein MCOR31_002267, partial [Pyricularia oryzae]
MVEWLNFGRLQKRNWNLREGYNVPQPESEVAPKGSNRKELASDSTAKRSINPKLPFNSSMKIFGSFGSVDIYCKAPTLTVGKYG